MKGRAARGKPHLAAIITEPLSANLRQRSCAVGIGRRGSLLIRKCRQRAPDATDTEIANRGTEIVASARLNGVPAVNGSACIAIDHAS
jgi:hypothetical protein